MTYPSLSDLSDVQSTINPSAKYKYKVHPDWEDLRHRIDATGDCKDFVLAKLHALLALSWPIAALRIAIVIVEPSARIAGETHAILMVSNKYALDIRQPSVCTIDELARIGYEPISIQEQGGSRDFVAWDWH